MTGYLARKAGRNLRARGIEKVYVLGENEGVSHISHTRATRASLTGRPRDIRPRTLRSRGRRLSASPRTKASDPSPLQ